MKGRAVRSLSLLALLLGSVAVTALPPVLSWSDGVAGGTSQVPEHLRECAEGFNYCKVRTANCGGCHGQVEDMRKQLSDEFPVTDRIGARVVINDNADLWEYRPGALYFVTVSIKFKNGFDDPARRSDARPAGYGDYSAGAFALNASAGSLQRLSGDETVRITGGMFRHHGSHNESYHYQCPNDPPGTKNCRYGGVEDNETRKAGEAVSTYAGSQQRQWQMTWRAPPRGQVPGVALQATVMVPDGNGADNCVHVACNASLGYSDQRHWDWWSNLIEDTKLPSIPRAIILCEEGKFDSRKDCQDAVLDLVLPPTPPPDTGGPGNGDDDGVFGNSPGLSPAAVFVLVLAVVGGHAYRRRR